MGSTNGDRITKEQRHKAGTCLLSPQSQRTRRQRTEGPGFDPWVGTIPWRRKWPPVGSQREELLPWQRSWGRKFGIRKGVIKPQETACSQTRVLYGELSPITISLGEGVNLQLQVNKNSWAWQECFNLWTLEVLWPAWSGSSGRMWLFTASQLWEAWDVLKLSKYRLFWEVRSLV